MASQLSGGNSHISSPPLPQELKTAIGVQIEANIIRVYRDPGTGDFYDIHSGIKVGSHYP